MDPLPIVLTDTSEYEPGVDEYGMSVYWSKITKENSVVPVLDIGVFNYHEFMAHIAFCKSNNSTSVAPRDRQRNIDQRRRPAQDDDDIVVFVRSRRDHEG